MCGENLIGNIVFRWCLYNQVRNARIDDLRINEIKALVAGFSTTSYVEWQAKKGAGEWLPLGHYDILVELIPNLESELSDDPAERRLGRNRRRASGPRKSLRSYKG